MKLNKKFINDNYIKMIKTIDKQDEYIIPEKIKRQITKETHEALLKIGRDVKYGKALQELRRERKRDLYHLKDFRLRNAYLNQEVLDFVEAFPEFEEVILENDLEPVEVFVCDDTGMQLPSFDFLKEIIKKEEENIKKE